MFRAFEFAETEKLVGNRRLSADGESGAPRDALDVSGQYGSRHRRGELEDRQGCVGSYFIAIGDSSSQFQAECRHDPSAQGNDQLTIAGANENASATGDLDIKSDMTISGKGSTKTIIDAAAIDRVLQILSGKVQISRVTIEHGRSNDGGGVLNSGGKVALTVDVFAKNLAEAGAGGLGAIGAGNGGGGGGFAGGTAFGGGISNEGGSLTISRTTIVANQTIGGAGGNGGSGGFMQGADGTGSGNGQAAIGGKGGSGGTGGAGIGGGIFDGIGSQLSIIASTITRNIASGGKGGSGGAGGDAVGGDASDNISGAAGNGGDAVGGASGAGGEGGPGEGEACSTRTSPP